MNIMFIFVVCFGVLVLVVIIATTIFNAKVGGSSLNPRHGCTGFVNSKTKWRTLAGESK